MMKLESKQRALDKLYDAMQMLYEARYMATGSYVDTQGKPGCYPEMCETTFSEIASMQTTLQRSISRLEKEIDSEMHPPSLSDQLKEEMCHGRSCQCNELQQNDVSVGGVSGVTDENSTK